LGKRTLTHESVKLTHVNAERALGMRTVKHEWGVNVIGVVNKCTYWCIYRALKLVTVNDIHGHSSQLNTLYAFYRSERPQLYFCVLCEVIFFFFILFVLCWCIVVLYLQCIMH